MQKALNRFRSYLSRGKREGIGYQKIKRGIGYRDSGIGKEEDFVYKIIFNSFSPYTLDPRPGEPVRVR
jgi:hypothetical protein